MPPFETVRGTESYYARLAHECSHRTKHPTRLVTVGRSMQVLLCVGAFALALRTRIYQPFHLNQRGDREILAEIRDAHGLILGLP
jgi:hypothetical protein